MKSLFLKIFLTFWVTMALGGIALVVVSALTQPVPFWDYVTGDTATKDVRESLAIYEREGAEALARRLAEIEAKTGVRIYVLDTQGENVTGAELPWPLRRVARRVASAGQDEVIVPPSPSRSIAARFVESPSGSRYAVFFWSPRSRGDRFSLTPESIVLRGLVVLLVSAAVCYGLARSLTTPILKVRSAAHEIADGNLSARAGESLAGRHDELADLGRDFDRMAERIETLVTAQQRLLGDISHELRSPLARLIVALDLARRRTGPDSEDLLNRIGIEADRIDELIGELLVLNRLESGDEIAHEEIDLMQLVEEVVDDADFEAQSTRRAVRIVERTDCMVAGDRNLLRRAIENVVRNAVHYTAEESDVEVAVTCEDSHRIVRIRDHGPGVPDADLPHLFRPFYRVAGARDRSSGGVGLGLAITERAIARHHGSVSVANADGEGLVVGIRLPRG